MFQNIMSAIVAYFGNIFSNVMVTWFITFSGQTLSLEVYLFFGITQNMDNFSFLT